MVDDPPFAAFLDALLAALEAVGAIVAGSQTSFDDMVGAWAGAAPPAVRGSFDIATDPERVLVERIRAGGGLSALTRGERRRFTVTAPLARAMGEFAREMIDANANFPAALATYVPDLAPESRKVAIFFSLLHAERLGAIVTRRRGLLYWLEGYAALGVVVAANRRPPRALVRRRNHEFYRPLRRGRNHLEDIVRSCTTDTDSIDYPHQLFIERQLTAMLEYRYGLAAHRIEIVAASTRPPTSPEMLRYTEYLRLLDAARVARDAQHRQRAALDEIIACRAAETDARARAAIYENKQVPARRELRRLQDAADAANSAAGRAAPHREVIERIERYLAAQAAGHNAVALAPRRDTVLSSLDTRLGLAAPDNMLVPGDPERWERYTAYLDKILEEGNSQLNTRNFDHSLLAACQHTEIGRDIGMPVADQRQFVWITRPGHSREAIDMNGPLKPIVLSCPDRFEVPARMPLPAGMARSLTYADSEVVNVEQPNERQDIFGKLAYGLLGRTRVQRRNFERYFDAHRDDRFAPDEVTRGLTDPRQISLILMALFATDLTAVNNVHLKLARMRRELADRMERELNDVLPGEMSAVLLDRERLSANLGGRYAFANALRGVPGRSPAEIRLAVFRILTGAPRESSASGRRDLVDELWTFLLALERAGAEVRANSGSAKIRHRYTGGTTDLFVTVLYSHLFMTGSVTPGKINRGDLIGEVGTTGNAENIHLHTETKVELGREQLGFCYPFEFFPLRPPP